jgi:hypothetical protein
MVIYISEQMKLAYVFRSDGKVVMDKDQNISAVFSV